MPHTMPLTLRRGTVTAVAERSTELVRLEVDGVPCVAYPALTGEVEDGDDVLVSVQARELGLGSGGFDVLHANLTRGLDLAAVPGAHVMKLPYTPLQHAVRHGEEDGPLADGLAGLPVVCCSLHSQVAPAAAALAGRRVAYVQLPGGALPVALSDGVRALRERGLLELAVGAGACFGGDLDAVNAYSALALAAGRGVDAVVCGIGPGVVGTATLLGHGGMAAAEAASVAHALGGEPILALRVSGADARERHRGTSHHARAVLACAPQVRAAWPVGCPLEPPDAAGLVDVHVGGWREATAGLPLRHMGRGPDADPWFFAAAFAAGRLAAVAAG
jgi:hypothetical protein